MSVTFRCIHGPADKEVNFCNSNAFQLLSAMGVEPLEFPGELPAAEFNHLAWQAWAKNDEALQPFVRPEHVANGWISFGSDAADIRERLLKVAALGCHGTIIWC